MSHDISVMKVEWIIIIRQGWTFTHQALTMALRAREATADVAKSLLSANNFIAVSQGLNIGFSLKLQKEAARLILVNQGNISIGNGIGQGKED